MCKLGRPRLPLADAEREARVREQNRLRAARKRQRAKSGARVVTLAVPNDVADALPDPDEGDEAAALIAFARRGIFRDLA